MKRMSEKTIESCEKRLALSLNSRSVCTTHKSREIIAQDV